MGAARDSKGQLLVQGVLVAFVLAACYGPAPSGTTPSPSAQTALPRLSIVHPATGDTVQAPVKVEYVIMGLNPDVVGQYRMRVTLDSPPIYSANLALAGLQGTAVLPDDKRITGRRDLTFSLVKADGTALANPEATVKISGVTITGRR